MSKRERESMNPDCTSAKKTNQIAQPRHQKKNTKIGDFWSDFTLIID